jgi:protein-L-isoaspartate O-methyltransferase
VETATVAPPDLDTELRDDDTPTTGDPEAGPEQLDDAGGQGESPLLPGATATYSPDDNKLRLRAPDRLDSGTYDRVYKAGFRWAPRQKVFVAGMWTPYREDLLLALCGKIDDEDTTLLERAKEHSERFTEYSGKRAGEARQVAASVSAIAGAIPFGQPILVGHHSERHARRDAERIEAGMRKGVRLWATAKYWTDRAQGALAHAKYKELPTVRYRRIRTIEADKRKQERTRDETAKYMRAWQRDELSLDLARGLAARSYSSSYTFPLADYPRPDTASQSEGPMSLYDALTQGIIAPQQARDLIVPRYQRTIDYAERWIQHYDFRLSYERAMLADQGGILAERIKPEVGGACQCLFSPSGIWSMIVKVNKVTVTIHESYSEGGRIFPRKVPIDKLHAIITRAEVDGAREAGRIVDREGRPGFYLTDVAPTRSDSGTSEDEASPAPTENAADDGLFASMRESLESGVQVVSASQLFPTPEPVAAQVVELAGIQAGQRVLEPSAGTGALLDRAIRSVLGFDCGVRVVAIEINHTLAEGLREMRRRWLYANDDNFDVRCSNFLECGTELGLFDRIIMNPPFTEAADVRHIQHAAAFLKPGGRLVAVCANGPRQRARLEPIATEWHDLPPDAFKASGTGVRTAIVVIDNED